jgi:hypothetical protein
LDVRVSGDRLFWFWIASVAAGFGLGVLAAYLGMLWSGMLS